jgi:hypothetical protein
MHVISAESTLFTACIIMYVEALFGDCLLKCLLLASVVMVFLLKKTIKSSARPDTRRLFETGQDKTALETFRHDMSHCR